MVFLSFIQLVGTRPASIVTSQLRALAANRAGHPGDLSYANIGFHPRRFKAPKGEGVREIPRM